MQGSLFDDASEGAPDAGAELSPLRTALAENLHRLAQEQIYFGVSSWKYAGWLGSIYTPSRYLARGKVSQKKFNESCLAEYAEVFPVVCGDFSFYQFPAVSFWENLFATSPQSLRFAFKVPEFITVKIFPNIPRWGTQSGLANEMFLDYRLLESQFLDLLRPYRNRVSCLIFEFSPIPRGVFADEVEFVERLATFIEQLPDDFRYAVEIRNPEFLSADYLGLLREHRIAHVFNAWTRMPVMSAQLELPDVHTTDFTVARALLRQGRMYEEAVREFEPYDRILDVNDEARGALFSMAQRARMMKQAALLFVNNRLEGNAPGTILGVIEMGL